MTQATSASLPTILDELLTRSEDETDCSFCALVKAARLDPTQDFVGASLRDVDFRDEDLSNFDFSNADLTGADFRRAKIDGARFNGAILVGVIGLSRSKPLGGFSASDLVKEVTTQSFVRDVIEESRHQPVLVDFWAEWCGPCKQLTPVLEKVIWDAAGKIKLAKMDIDKHPAIPGQMGIQSIPAIIAFANGQPVDGFLGALPESQVITFVERITRDNIPSKALSPLKMADDMPGGGDAEEIDVYEILRKGANRATAVPSPSSTHIHTRSTEQAMPARARRSGGKRREAAALSEHKIARRIGSVRSIPQLERRVAANPLDHQSRFDLAIALNAAGKRREAADHLIDIVKRSRNWNKDGARKQLVQFFESWGSSDEIVVEGRRRLSSILFA